MEQNKPTINSPSTGGRRMRFLAGILVFGALFTIGYLPKLHSAQALAADAVTDASEAPEVELVSPKLAPSEPLLLPGSIQAFVQTSLQARTSGYVKTINADIGAQVKAGQVLAEIDSPDADQQSAQANADAAKSRATVGQSIADVARTEAGVTQSQSELIRQRAAIKQTQAAAASSAARLEQALAAEAQAEAKVAQSRQSVEIQRANQSQAKAQFDLAAATVKRYESLLKEGFVSQQDYDQSAASYKTSSASVKSAQANVQASEADLRASEQALKASHASVQAARADTEAAQANIQASQASLQSLKSTVEAARASVRASMAGVDANRAAVQSSDANARRYGVLSSFKTVIAPFDGVITARNVDIGSLVSPGAITPSTTNSTTPSVGLFGIARVDVLRVFVNVPQTDFQSVKAGTKATILIRELPNEKFTGTVVQSSGALNAASRTLLAEIQIPNPANRLLPGMFAQVQIDPKNRTESIRIPASAMIVDAKGTRVATVDAQNVVHLKSITLGKDYGAEVEVIGGLNSSDHLVNNPTDDLQDGVRVRPAKGGKS